MFGNDRNEGRVGALTRITCFGGTTDAPPCETSLRSGAAHGP